MTWERGVGPGPYDSPTDDDPRPEAGRPMSDAATVRHTVWKGSPMRRYTRCPVHGCLVVQRWTLRSWQWIHGCEGCMDEAMSALAAIGVCVEGSMP